MREVVSAAAIAREASYLERSVPFSSAYDLDLGPGFPAEIARRFSIPAHTAQVRNFHFSSIMYDPPCGLLFEGERPVKDSHYLLWDEQFEQSRIIPSMLREQPAGRQFILGYNNGYRNYYHWMLQAVPAIYTSLLALRGGDSIVVLPQLEDWQEKTLLMLGLADIPRLSVGNPHQYLFPELYYSEFLNGVTAFQISLRAIQALHRLRAAVARKPVTNDLIYVARTDSQHRVAVNEPELIRALEGAGVGIVVPGSLPIEDQINIFRAARVVIGAHGAGLSNLSFCQAGTIVYELLPEHYLNPCMNRLAHSGGMHYIADTFKSHGAGETHHRTWELDVDRVIWRLQQIISRLGRSNLATR